jgi:hypothetical protein
VCVCDRVQCRVAACFALAGESAEAYLSWLASPAGLGASACAGRAEALAWSAEVARVWDASAQLLQSPSESSSAPTRDNDASDSSKAAAAAVVLVRVASDYYAWSLAERRNVLRAPSVDHLCKVVLMENTHCETPADELVRSLLGSTRLVCIDV